MNSIKFNQQGIEAILNGSKTMTRRPIKEDVLQRYRNDKKVDFRVDNTLQNLWHFVNVGHGDMISFILECKYKVGETVFVQEELGFDLRMYHPHELVRGKEHIQDCESSSKGALCGYQHHCFSSNGDTITLEWAKANILNNDKVCRKCSKKTFEILNKESRIFLKITDIKVERLQDISGEDCIKEGGEVACMSCDDLVIDCKCIESEHDNHKDIFRYYIWNFTPYKAPYDWSSNPYVFVYEFEVVK